MEEFTPNYPHTALVLTGGGARAAYQAGAMRKVSEIAEEMKIKRPFTILSGTSAGAVNAASLAALSQDWLSASKNLAETWKTLSTDMIFRSDLLSMGSIAYKWLWKVVSGGLLKESDIKALLDTSPLRKFLTDSIPYSHIQKNIDRRIIYSLAITALDYTDGSSHVFFQGKGTSLPWRRMRRSGEETLINAEHIMASSAIPILFPPIQIGTRWFGDGSIRNYSPFSPMLRMGAKQILIIPARARDKRWIKEHTTPPSFGKVLSLVLNSILMDGVDFDYDRLMRVNRLVQNVPSDVFIPATYIDVCIIRPSVDLGRIALEESYSMPRALRYLVSGLGPKEQADDLISYLLFEPAFIERIIDLGYNDAKRQEGELISFFKRGIELLREGGEL